MALLSAKYRAANLKATHTATGLPIYAVRCGSDLLGKKSIGKFLGIRAARLQVLGLGEAGDEFGGQTDDTVYGVKPCSTVTLGKHLATGLNARHPTSGLPVQAAGCVECEVPPQVCVPALPCDPLSEPERLRVVITNRLGCPCLNGYSFVMVKDPNLRLWNAMFQIGCGLPIGDPNNGAGLFVGLVGTYSFLSSWLRIGRFEGLRFHGAANCTGYAQFPQYNYPLLGVTVTCNPFFIQLRGLRLDSELTDPFPCEGQGLPGQPRASAMIDVTIVPEP